VNFKNEIKDLLTDKTILKIKKHKINRPNLIKDYLSGMTYRNLANKYDRVETTIRYILVKEKVKLRGHIKVRK